MWAARPTGAVARTASETAVPQAHPTAADTAAARAVGAAVTHGPAAVAECRAWAVREAVGVEVECHAAEADSRVAEAAADADRR